MATSLSKTYSYISLNDFGAKLYRIIICVAVFLFCFAILFRADWTIGDDYESLQSTAIGMAEPMSRHIGQGNIANGRFYPLGHYDLNILSLIPGGAGPISHYAYICVQFLIFIALLLKIIRLTTSDTSGNYYYYVRILLFLLLVSSPGLPFFFLGINYPERLLMLLLSAFILLSHKAISTQKAEYYILSVIIAFYSSYMKEPVFAIYCVFSLANLLFYKNISKKDRYFFFSLLFNGFLFLLLYYFLAFRNHSSLYSTSFNFDILNFCRKFLMSEKTNGIIIFFALYRLIRILLKKDTYSIFTDSLLFSGAAYTLSYAVLGFTYPYYFVPSLLLSIPAFNYEFGKTGSKIRSIRYTLFICFIVIVCLNILSIKPIFSMFYVGRTTHMDIIRTVSAHKSGGGDLYWYVKYPMPKNVINNNISGQRHIYNVFLDYVARNENSITVPGNRENFKSFYEAGTLGLKDEDVVFIPVYIGEHGIPIPFDNQIMKKLEKENFVPLKCNLIYVKIFIKKGSYIEPNWLLNRTGQ